jgi:cysteine-S-conjugate beta-lyase
MSFDFDTPIDRCGSDSKKWTKYAGRDVLPLWVADMDFAAPPAVLDALHRRVDHGVFGYGRPWPSLVEAVQEHLEREYAWQIQEDWLVWLPGLVTGLNVACRAAGETNSAVFTATPVYPPFLFEHTEHAIATNQADTLLLCHPHNPVGRAWHEDELAELARLAEKHDLTVCSDEIHCDLILDAAATHRPFASRSPEMARRTITLMAPSKAFNVPGLGCAFAVIADARLRRNFVAAMRGIVPHVNVLGFTACEAAFRHGAPWRHALLDYLRGNARRVESAVSAINGLSMTPVEATYLAWIDAREMCATLGIDNPQRFFEEAGVGLSDGADFGAPGFVRLNFGCSRATLDQALARMRQAITAQLARR